MKSTRFLMLIAMMFSVVAISVPVSAAKKKSFDLYSWHQEGSVNYCYALLPASKDVPAVDVIKASPDKVCGGSGDLKRIVGQAAPLNSKLHWRVDTAKGMVLPDRGIINDFHRFAETMPYKLEVAEPK